MILLDPKNHDRPYPDSRSSELMRKTIGFFEAKGKAKLLEDYYARPWYADFLEFVKQGAHLRLHLHARRRGRCPTRVGTPGAICEFAEILGFYGLQYWYTWQVSVLGLGPIWMSDNEALRQRAAAGAGGRRHLRLRALREDPRRRHLLHRHGAHPRRLTAGEPTDASTTSATATRPPSSPPSAASRTATTTSSSPPTRSTRAITSSRTWWRARTTSPSSSCATTRCARPTSCTAVARPGTRRSIP